MNCVNILLWYGPLFFHSLDPSFFDAKLLLADTLQQVGKSQDALLLYKSLLRENKNHFEVNHNYATILHEKGLKNFAFWFQSFMFLFQCMLGTSEVVFRCYRLFQLYKTFLFITTFLLPTFRPDGEILLILISDLKSVIVLVLVLFSMLKLSGSFSQRLFCF